MAYYLCGRFEKVSGQWCEAVVTGRMI